jgi:hypothetical protein
MTVLYHYTNGNKISSIIRSGIIISSPEKPKPREKSIAWLSSNPLWEKTANKIILQNGISTLLNQTETSYYCRGLFRFVFDLSTYPGEIFQWPKLAVKARIPDGIKKRLVSRAKKASVKPEQWYGLIGNMNIAHSKLEVYVDGTWMKISINDAKPIDNGIQVHDAGTTIQRSVSEEQWKKI